MPFPGGISSVHALAYDPFVHRLSHGLCLFPLVPTRYLGPDYGEAGAVDREAVTAAQIPGLARQSFPLCMALMAQHLHAESHLRHTGRMQLGLFLKVRLA